MKAITKKLGQLVAALTGPFTMRAQHTPVGCTNIRALLMHLCDFDEATFAWMLRWIAYPLKNPGAKLDMAVVVNGEGGTGKSLMFERVVAGLYEDGARTLPASQLHSPFNHWADGIRLAVVEGVFTKRNAARLKDLTSAVSLQIATRFEPAQRRKNRMNFVFLSTSSEFLPVLESDRRLFVLEVPPRRPRAFYSAVFAEIDNGGIDAFRDYLMRNLDMTGFDEHTRPPAAPAMRAVA
jgi:putative DNA primase/helicase